MNQGFGTLSVVSLRRRTKSEIAIATIGADKTDDAIAA